METTLKDLERALASHRSRANAAFYASVVSLAASAFLPFPYLGALLFAASTMTFVAFAAATLVALHRFAAEAGGPRYAATQTALAAALTPVFGIGVLLVPFLVIRDAENRVAAYRRATAPPLGRTLLETYMTIAAFVVVAPLPLFFGFWGLLVAIVLLIACSAGTARWLRRESASGDGAG